MTPQNIAIAVLFAVLIVLAAFYEERSHRARLECKEHGHQWQQEGEWLRCRRCGIAS